MCVLNEQVAAHFIRNEPKIDQLPAKKKDNFEHTEHSHLQAQHDVQLSHVSKNSSMELAVI